MTVHERAGVCSGAMMWERVKFTQTGVSVRARRGVKKGAKLCERVRALCVCEHEEGSDDASVAVRASASDARAKGSE